MKTEDWKRSGKIVHHHIVNKCNGGKSLPCNLLALDEKREKAWHFIFGNLSFIEVAKLLTRVAKIKQSKK